MCCWHLSSYSMVMQRNRCFLLAQQFLDLSQISGKEEIVGYFSGSTCYAFFYVVRTLVFTPTNHLFQTFLLYQFYFFYCFTTSVKGWIVSRWFLTFLSFIWGDRSFIAIQIKVGLTHWGCCLVEHLTVWHLQFAVCICRMHLIFTLHEVWGWAVWSVYSFNELFFLLFLVSQVECRHARVCCPCKYFAQYIYIVVSELTEKHTLVVF